MESRAPAPPGLRAPGATRQVGSAGGDESVRSGGGGAARETLGAEHWFYGNFLGKHGRALAALERFDDAESALLEAHGILQTALGDEHGQTKRVVGYLADLYDAWGKPQIAGEWRAKLDTAQEALATHQPQETSSDDRQDE